MPTNYERTAIRALRNCGAVVATAFAVIHLSACRSQGDDSANARAASIPAARVAIAQRGDISHVLTLAGQFQPYQVVDVHPKVSGYMRKINVDIGDIVHEGQSLATLEVPELKAQLQQTVFQVDQSKEEITRAQHEINRAEAQHQALHEQYVRLQQAGQGHPGLIAEQELDNARAADLSAEAQADAARAALAGAKQHLGSAQSENQRVQALHDYTNVVAPISGVVVWRYADTGALIQGGTNSNSQDLPIVRLSQSSLLRLRLPVPEGDVRYVRDGDQVQVRVDAINRSLTGKVVRFTRDVNFETRTMETEVDVDNKDLSISPGMYANTMLRLAHVDRVVTIPIEAIVLQGRQQVVYALDDSNHVHVRQVQVGIEGSKLAEIKSGLQPGERVILGGQEKYQDGEVVSPAVAESPASETQQETGGTIDLKADQPDGRTDSESPAPPPASQPAKPSSGGAR
ncbi:efflux RND transporter periplasmic adaptor subunit [Occallatibacter riparius]|uniref:Efflux RND transporter periplasmic adaptor subunit n=1 Tax=Occallatibacter riparius TaxID=1002689 RepID=A0A9J7BNT8_9BACT|nr:efflux RND transporter periplasmic adaptor subunit [Occallatibacter riparius]UWZ84548.1 efflux RND transporter periplasmic adaptor subunit [Occallatibacter riparius]